MAEASDMLRKMKEGLNCSICLDTYTEPKQLLCNHVYCQKCLLKLLTPGQLSITCPSCRYNTPIPGNGVAGLQSAFQIIPFLKIVDDQESKRASILVPKSSQRVVTYCSSHQGKELEFYCETCGILICYKCAVKGGRHCNHDYSELMEAFQAYKGQATAVMSPMEKNLATVKESITALRKRHKEVTDQKAAISTALAETARKLKESIDTKKNALTIELNKIIDQKLKDLELQIDKASTTQAQFSSSLDSMKASLATKNHGEVLKAKKATIKQAKELTSSFRPSSLTPTVEADVSFSSLTDICEVHGQILKCWASGEGLEKAVVGRQTTVTLNVAKFDGRASEDISKSIECELVSSGSLGDRCNVSVTKSLYKYYSISYRISSRDTYKLHIKVGGLHIKGSPFSIVSKSASSRSREVPRHTVTDYWDQ